MRRVNQSAIVPRSYYSRYVKSLLVPCPLRAVIFRFSTGRANDFSASRRYEEASHRFLSRLGSPNAKTRGYALYFEAGSPLALLPVARDMRERVDFREHV